MKIIESPDPYSLSGGNYDVIEFEGDRIVDVNVSFETGNVFVHTVPNEPMGKRTEIKIPLEQLFALIDKANVFPYEERLAA